MREQGHAAARHGFRNARSSSRRSIPNFIELRGERIGVVEIRLAGRVL